jgi:Xaa-Pro aminopeptidase
MMVVSAVTVVVLVQIMILLTQVIYIEDDVLVTESGKEVLTIAVDK